MMNYFYIGWYQFIILRKDIALVCRDYEGGQKALFSRAFFRATDNLRRKYNKMTTPFLMMMTKKDKFVSTEGEKEFFDKASSRDKSILFLNNGLHHFYIERPEIRNIAVKKTIQWIELRV